jgi:hypothetical protein
LALGSFYVSIGEHDLSVKGDGEQLVEVDAIIQGSL